MTISRQDTAIIKAIGILSIVLHNLAHWFPNAVKENEYDFNPNHISFYWEQIVSGDWQVFLNFLSHYGHYGICGFLFVSGYGLVKKYESTGSVMPSSLKFLFQHAVKLWRLMIPALLLFVVANLFQEGTTGLVKFWVANLLIFTSNLIPDRLFVSLFGPWWWFSLIMQCYVFYRLVLYRNKSIKFLVGITLFTLIVQGIVSQTEWRIHLMGRHEHLLTYLRYNLFGQLLPFACGIIWARLETGYVNREKTASILTTVLDRGAAKILFPLSMLLLCLSSLSIWLWFISPLFAIIATLSLARLLSNCGVITNTFVWIGTISPFIFCLSPVVRGWIADYAMTSAGNGQLGLSTLWLLLYLLVSIVLAWIFTKLDSYIQLPKWLS